MARMWPVLAEQAEGHRTRSPPSPGKLEARPPVTSPNSSGLFLLVLLVLFALFGLLLLLLACTTRPPVVKAAQL